MKLLNTIYLLFIISMFTLSCNAQVMHTNDEAYKNLTADSSLKSFANFPIGAGARLRLYKSDSDYVKVLKKHFNSLTFETELKHEFLVNNKGHYDFTKADEFIKLATTAGFRVHGHTLVYHKSSNGFFLRSLRSKYDTNKIDPARVDSALKDFIIKTVSHFKGKIKSWDVVNEALQNGTGARITNLKNDTSAHIFYFGDYLGRNYIARSFNYARMADPDAVLFINEDHLESDNRKLDSMMQLIKELKAAKIPVDGIGVQMHITIKIDKNGITKALKTLASTGLQIRISEMDISLNPDNDPHFKLNDKLLKQQKELYQFVVETYCSVVPKAQQYGITFWDISDRDSWINIIQHGNDHPTLFDAEYKAKPAFFGVLKALSGK